MAARSIGSGTISFGLVSIPVKLYSATQASAGISFNLLHKKDGARLRQQYLCSLDGEVVPRDEMVKGYEIAKDRYVQFTAEELKALEEKATQAIEINEFLPLKAIDPVYFDKAYYLSSDKGGEKAYRLLSEVMHQTGRCALARYAARGKQVLVLLRPLERGLVMQQLLYADEVRPFSEVPQGADTQLKEGELKLATEFVDKLTSKEFHPEVYEDDVKKRTLEAIQKKVEGEEIAAAPAEEGRAQIIDLMEALKASLDQKGASHVASAKAEPKADRKPPKRAPHAASEGSKKHASKK